jgi:hypothetical protein
VVNQVVVMTLSQDDGNIFNSINLLSTIARLLLLELRGGDAALEKLSVKKMAQVRPASQHLEFGNRCRAAGCCRSTWRLTP